MGLRSVGYRKSTANVAWLLTNMTSQGGTAWPVDFHSLCAQKPVALSSYGKVFLDAGILVGPVLAGVADAV